MSTHAIHPIPAPLTAAPTHHRDGRPVPRWATTAAHLVALCALPSGLWRIPLAFGFSMGMLETGGAEVHMHGWESLYVIGLSVVLEGLALLTLGLVRPWGERAPRWIPLLGGRRLRPMAVVVPALAGAFALTWIWIYAISGFFTRDVAFTHDGWQALIVVAYMPLLAWGPLLAAVTIAYWRRRCRD